MSEEMYKEDIQILSEQLLTGSDVAQVLKVSRSFAYQLLQRGEIPAVRFGRIVRVRRQDLELFIANNITTQDTPVEPGIESNG